VTSRVHRTAVVEPGAVLADDVEVGPFAVIGAQVEIGAGSSIGSHVVLAGRTRLGRDNRIFPFCAIGGVPQDKKYAGEDTRLEIGDGNTIREGCTINVGTVQGGGVTRIGADNWIMAYVHIAHDCMIGDHTILANTVLVAGHVTIDDWVVVGGATGIHQFARVGAHAMVGAGTILVQDVPPFVTCGGRPTEAHGINSEGLRRRGFTPETINALRRAYRIVFREGHTVADACVALDALAEAAVEARPHVQLLRAFIAAPGRGIVR